MITMQQKKELPKKRSWKNLKLLSIIQNKLSSVSSSDSGDDEDDPMAFKLSTTRTKSLLISFTRKKIPGIFFSIRFL